MIEPRVLGGAAQRLSDIASGPNLREGALIAHAVVADGCRLSGLAGRPRLREPLVLLVSDDARAVRERHPVARAAGPRLTDGHDARGTALLVEHLVAGLDLSHRRPAGGRRDRRIQCQCLPNSRTSRDDDELSGVQAVGQRIQIGEARGHADHLAAAIGNRLDLGECSVHEIAQREVVLRRAPFGDLIDLSLRPIDDVIDIALTGVPHLHDARAGLDQPAQDGALLDDGRVVAGIGRGGHE